MTSRNTAGLKRGNDRTGIPNKSTALLKDAILKAAEAAGGEEGLTGYLTARAKDEPVAFMSLLGKVLPMQVSGEDGGPVKIVVEWQKGE